MNNFVRVYPRPGTEKYDKFFTSASPLFGGTRLFKVEREIGVGPFLMSIADTAASLARRQSVQTKMKELKETQETEANKQKRYIQNILW